jgi:uncharacterized membrane-anchored protein
MITSRLFTFPPLAAALVVAIVQTGVLGYMIESRASILRNGTDVRLKTLPVDPRDLLRGDYVILSYPISTIPKDIVTGDVPKVSGVAEMSVRLKPGADGLWTATEASFATLPAEEGSVVIRSQPFEFYPYAEGTLPDTTFLNFGIERYYVPEGEGKVLEDARNQEELEVDIRVSTSGTAQISRILLRGEPVYDEPLY